MIRRSGLFILMAAVLMTLFMNCGKTGAPPETVFSEKLNSGNGEGYAGMSIDAPLTALAGKTVRVSVMGGTAPYQFLIIEGSGQVVSSAGNTAQLYFPGSINEFELNVVRVVDALGQAAEAQISIIGLSSETGNSLGDVKFFGFHVELHSDEAFIGFPSASEDLPGSILHYVKNESWALTEKIILPVSVVTPSERSWFGQYFVVDKNNLAAVVGTQTQRLFIFNRGVDGSFALKQILHSSETGEDGFGQHLTMADGMLFVRGVKTLENPDGANSIYVFAETAGEFRYLQTLKVPLPQSAKMIYSGGYLYVNSHHKVMIYKFENGVLGAPVAVIESPLGEKKFFGWDFSLLAGKFLVVTDPNADYSRLVGRAFVFEMSGGQPISWERIDLPEVVSLNPYNNTAAMTTAMLSPTQVVIGFPTDYYTIPGTSETGNFGSVVLFSKVDGHWRYSYKFTAESGSRTFSAFGHVLSVSGGSLLIGATRSNLIRIFKTAAGR